MPLYKEDDSEEMLLTLCALLGMYLWRGAPNSLHARAEWEWWYLCRDSDGDGYFFSDTAQDRTGKFAWSAPYHKGLDKVKLMKAALDAFEQGKPRV
jgi:hypothetical protein